MKVGSLVKWKHPGAESFGVVTKGPFYSGYWSANAVSVVWLDGRNHGEYPVNHKWMELVSESR